MRMRAAYSAAHLQFFDSHFHSALRDAETPMPLEEMYRKYLARVAGAKQLPDAVRAEFAVAVGHGHDHTAALALSSLARRKIALENHHWVEFFGTGAGLAETAAALNAGQDQGSLAAQETRNWLKARMDERLRSFLAETQMALVTATGIGGAGGSGPDPALFQNILYELLQEVPY